VDAAEHVLRGREAFARRAWKDAHAALSVAQDLRGHDLERLATAAYMLAREDEYVEVLERAHRAHAEAGDSERAARCALWLSLHLMLRGEMGRASGWRARGRRLLDRERRDCVERAFLRMLGAFADERELAAVVAEAERFGDADLMAIAGHQRGHALVAAGRIEEGIALFDENMVAVTAGELSPIATGLVYCSVIDGCQRLHELRRAREWTDALARWCEQQPDLVAFTGRCLVHRAEIMQVHGSWDDALTEAGEAARRLSSGPAAGEAHYREGELHRLRGELAAAEQAYRNASRCGREPQPGLALLRLAQGRTKAAVAAIRRVVEATEDPWRGPAMLPALVEIALAAGDLESARHACDELDALAEQMPSPVLGAACAQARGAVHLADGDPRAALGALHAAAEVWQELEAPYEAARVRELRGLACRALGDEDSARLELEAAHEAYVQLGAARDLARLGGEDAGHGLSPRELQVLRLVAAGATNREIAAELTLSERTVDRHVSNILAKLRVPTRAAATAYAYEHHLVG
jgi:DNA-binding CsgD family transcriptional regulator